MKQIKYLVLILITLSGCNSPKQASYETNAKIIVVDDIQKEAKPFSDFFKLKKIVVLETNNDCLIGELEKIVVTSERLYIYDLSNESIKIFNFDGQFLYKIHHKGKGPGEYISITDFQIDEKTLALTIYDANTSKLITYADGGKYVNEVPYSFPVEEFVKFDNSLALYCGNSGDVKNMCQAGECSNFLIEKNNEIIYRDCPISQTQMGNYYIMSRFNAIQYTQDKIYLTEPLGHIIYSISNEKLTPEYILDYGVKTIPSDLSNIDVDFNYIDEFNHSINNIYENDQFFFFQFNNKKFTKAVVLNKKSGECAYVKTYRDNKNGMKLKLISTKGKHNYLVSLIDAADFNEDYNKEFNSKKNKITPVQEEMHKTLKPTDNPALILYEGLVMP